VPWESTWRGSTVLAVDTNVVVRLVVGDDPAQQQRAEGCTKLLTFDRRLLKNPACEAP
jgi:hypothetical protein